MARKKPHKTGCLFETTLVCTCDSAKERTVVLFTSEQCRFCKGLNHPPERCPSIAARRGQLPLF